MERLQNSADAPVYDGSFFDGVSAAEQQARIVIGANALDIETARAQYQWPYSSIEINGTETGAIRISNKRHADAVLILPLDAGPALQAAAPDIYSGARARRRGAALIISLVAGAALVMAAIFIGVPAAAGPMARATPQKLEMQIGENLAAQIRLIMKPCDDEAAAIVSPIITDMAAKGDAGFPIEFRFVRTRVPNAFALPGGQVMATSGLMKALEDDQEAFFAVMAHEIGHVRARDGMQAVYRNAGLGVALEIITGGSGAAQQAVLIGGQLSQLRHTRRQETKADETAAEIMLASGMDPAALARAFDAISRYYDAEIADENESEQDSGVTRGKQSLPSWLRTHPDTSERIENARSKAAESGAPPLSAEEWRRVSTACQAREEE